MNIFNTILEKIKFLILENKDELNIENLNDFKGVVVESPPTKFNYDLSSNICLILAKLNNLNPVELADKFKIKLIEEKNYFDEIEVAGPGFLNFRLKDFF